jgi:hypothetical protein
MKLLIAILALASTTTAFAGPTSSGGVGAPMHIKLCAADASHKIQITTYTSGQSSAAYYQGQESGTLMTCGKVPKAKNPLAEKTLFACAEKRAGEGLVRIVVMQNSQGAQIATAYRQDILGSYNREVSYLCEDLL